MMAHKVGGVKTFCFLSARVKLQNTSLMVSREIRDGGLAPKLVRLNPKLDKYGTFSDQISVHLAR